MGGPPAPLVLALTDSQVVQLGLQAIVVATKLAAPILAVALVVGLVISVFQSVTQIQEVTLTFVPKLVGIAIVLVLTGSWMLGQLVDFTRTLFQSLPTLLQ